MSSATRVRCAVPAKARLGECPLWSQSEGVLYWVDIDGKAVHRFDPRSLRNETRTIGARPGSIGLTAQPGRLLLGSEDSLGVLDWASGRTIPWIELDSVGPGVRLNDGRCDPAGRYWTGSMYDPASANRFDGCLYRIEPDGSSEAVRRQVGVANGIAFSPDGSTMYFADTLRDTVWSFDYDVATGSATNEQVFLDFSNLPGRPDGACVDESGCYWVACVFGWAVARVTPAGDVDRVIELPVEKPTMPAFGGDGLRTLFVTSIGDGGPIEIAETQQEPGGLFALEPGVAGLPEPVFAGPLPKAL